MVGCGLTHIYTVSAARRHAEVGVALLHAPTHLRVGFEIDFVGARHDPDVSVHQFLQSLRRVVPEQCQEKPMFLKLVFYHLIMGARTSGSGEMRMDS